MCELMFPKPIRKKKRKHHPAPIVDTVKGECFLCRLEGIRRQQYTEEHHVFYGGGLRQVSEEKRCSEESREDERKTATTKERQVQMRTDTCVRLVYTVEDMIRSGTVAILK